MIIRSLGSTTIRLLLRYFPLQAALVCGLAVATAAAQDTPPLLSGRVRAQPPRPTRWAGDVAGADDPIVRQAATTALGDDRGAVVVVDPETGRLLTVVNQKLAYSSGYIPCSTIKLVAGLAAIEEGLVEPDTKVWFDGYWFMTMTEGLAISNNVYFSHLGERLGFERLKRYAHRYGFGERAGWNLPGEQLGEFPATEHSYGIGRMTTYGNGISATPLQLAAFVSAIANGGKLYYLQRSNDEDDDAFTPRLKRDIGLRENVRGLQPGMAKAVHRGTARKARTPGQKIWGKTGTCSERIRRRRTPLGWFASYNEAEGRRLVVVVMLKGRSDAAGPRAAEVAGKIYRALGRQAYFSAVTEQHRFAAANLSGGCVE